MPKYVMPEGPPTLTGSLPGGGARFGMHGAGGGGPPHAAAAMGMGGHGRRYSHFAPAGGGGPPRGGGGSRRESNGSGRTTPSSLPVRIVDSLISNGIGIFTSFLLLLEIQVNMSTGVKLYLLGQRFSVRGCKIFFYWVA